MVELSPTHCLTWCLFPPVANCQSSKYIAMETPSVFFNHRNIHVCTANKTPFVMDFYDRSLASLGGHLWGRSLKSLKRCHPRKPKQLPTPRACRQAGGRVRFASHPFVRKGKPLPPKTWSAGISSREMKIQEALWKRLEEGHEPFGSFYTWRGIFWKTLGWFGLYIFHMIKHPIQHVG